jgi:hypothetical protein
MQLQQNARTVERHLSCINLKHTLSYVLAQVSHLQGDSCTKEFWLLIGETYKFKTLCKIHIIHNNYRLTFLNMFKNCNLYLYITVIVHSVLNVYVLHINSQNSFKFPAVRSIKQWYESIHFKLIQLKYLSTESAFCCCCIIHTAPLFWPSILYPPVLPNREMFFTIHGTFLSVK